MILERICQILNTLNFIMIELETVKLEGGGGEGIMGPHTVVCVFKIASAE